MRYAVRITANFDANLVSIKEFLAEQDAAHAFESLLQQLFDNIIPHLESFPKMGRDFLAVEPLSQQGKARLRTLKTRAGNDTEIREYIAGDYLLLYALRRSTVFLMAIRHHRQLSFDLRGHWG